MHTHPQLNKLINSASTEQLRLAVSSLLLGLHDLGFGTDDQISVEAIDEIASLFNDVTGRILADASSSTATNTSPQSTPVEDTPADQLRGLSLRVQAQSLLEQAQALDGMRPFAATHAHEYGATSYLIWAQQAPTAHQAANLVGADFEPHKNESFKISEPFSHAELCGTQVSTRLDASQAVAPAVTEFLALLAQASAVTADSPLLSEWETSEPTGDESNQVVRFSWETQDGTYGLALTEGGIAAGKWQDTTFLCEDDEGDEVRISLFKHFRLSPLTTRACMPGDLIRVALLGQITEGVVTGFGSKDGQRIVHYEPGHQQSKPGTLGSCWTYFSDIVAVCGRSISPAADA